jgi:hypothetical protein
MLKCNFIILVKIKLSFSINKITIRTMLADKRNTTNNSSNYRISVAKPLLHSKHTSNRSISIAHTANSKKEISQNSSIVANKNVSIERIYSNN